MDIWESSFDTVAPDGLDKTLWDVQASAHIYLDGFRAALAEPVEIPEESETETKPDAAVSDANAVQATVNAAGHKTGCPDYRPHKEKTTKE